VVTIGRANVVKEGADVTIVSFSMSMSKVLEATEKLENDGVSVEIIDLRTLRPLDIDTIVRSVKKTNRLLCVEEGWPYAGICSEITAQVMEQAFDYLDAPILRVTGADVPMPYAVNLEQLALPQVDDIIGKVKSYFK
jgi:pyruvate dehydrogenase E1 component beta subunit